MITKWEKRFLAVLLAGTMTVQSGMFFPDTVFAQEGNGVVPEEVYPQGTAESIAYSGTPQNIYETRSPEEWAVLIREMETRLTDTLLAGEYSVDMTGLDLSYQEFLWIDDIIPYYGNGIRAFDYTEGESIDLINPMSEEETRALVELVSGKVGEAESQITDGMTDAQKALAIHDYLVYNCAYDYDNYINGTIPQDSYRCSGMLINGTGVCQGYAMAFQYFMMREGIECHVTSSASMNHAWNIVKIDGSYYHVDCTWDDPVPDSPGRAGHSHFLASDSKMQNELEHFGWDRTDLVCDSTEYDSAYWADIDSPLISLDNGTYYIKFDETTDTGKLLVRTGENETVAADLGKWLVWNGEGSYWLAAYSGLFYSGGYLYYNTSEKIMRIAPGASNPEAVYAPDLSEGYIYGCWRVDDEIHYVIKQEAKDKGTVYTIPISGEEPEYTRGDVDDNGVVNISDLRMILRSVCGKLVLTDTQKLAADVETDGNVDITDLRKMLRFVCQKIDSLD